MTYDVLSVEQRVLVLSSRLTFSDNVCESLSTLINEEFDWYTFFIMAIKNKVAPLVYANLKKFNLIQNMPNQLEKVFRFYYIGTKHRNECYLIEANKILISLTNRGIKVVPLKGSYLIGNIYLDYGVRTINDIDCMIGHSDRQAVFEIMEEMGYKQGEYDETNKRILPINRRKQIFWKMKMNNLYPFIKISDSEYCNLITCDFCFSLDLNLDYEPIGEMLGNLTYNEQIQLYLLKSSYFLVHLCAHLFKEASNTIWVSLDSDLNLIKFCDVREYILHAMNESEWKESISFANRHHMAEGIYFTLFYLREIYNDGYETEILSQLEIKDTMFLDGFGERDYLEMKKWKKTFWERLFAISNNDELLEDPKYASIDKE